MSKLLIQFYATPIELVGFLNHQLSEGLTLVGFKRSPFEYRFVQAAEGATVPQLQWAEEIGIFHSKPSLDAEDWSKFLAAHNEGIFLKVGKLEKEVLSQSWLSAQSNCDQVIKRWRRAADWLKRRTSAGVWVVNPSTQATGLYKQFRFTEGALQLFDEGCRLAPPAGTNLIYLREPSSDQAANR